MSKFGKAKYGGTKRNYFKMKDGDNVFAILPPMNIGNGKLGDSGVWSTFYNIHYGYKNSEGKLRPFQSSLVKNRKSKMIEVPDAALERIEKLKAQLEAAKKAGDSKLVAKLNEFVGPKGSFNLDNNHYVNALDAQGNVGVLKMRHRCKVALDAVIKKLRESGVDPLDPDNLHFFVINRSGTGLDTTFQVSLLTKKLTVQGVGEVEQKVTMKIDDAMATRIFSEAADLSSLFKRPTSDEIARIVAEGASAVDEILDGKGANGSSSGEGSDDYDDSGDYEDESSSAQSASATTTTTTTTSVAASAGLTNNTVSTPVQAAAPSAPVQASASVAGAAAAATSTSAPASTTAAQIDGLSDADFLKAMGL